MSPKLIPAHIRIFPYTHSLTLIPPHTYMLYSEHTHPHLHLLILKCSLMYIHSNSYLLAPTYFLNTLSPTPTPRDTLLYAHSPTLTPAHTHMLFLIIYTITHAYSHHHTHVYTLSHRHIITFTHT